MQQCIPNCCAVTWDFQGGFVFFPRSQINTRAQCKKCNVMKALQSGLPIPDELRRGVVRPRRSANFVRLIQSGHCNELGDLCRRLERWRGLVSEGGRGTEGGGEGGKKQMSSRRAPSLNVSAASLGAPHMLHGFRQRHIKNNTRQEKQMVLLLEGTFFSFLCGCLSTIKPASV